MNIPERSSLNIKVSYESLVILHFLISLEYSGNFSIPFKEKLESLACSENDDASVSPLNEHLFTM